MPTYEGVSVPVLAAFWRGNRRGKNRAGTIGGAQYRFAHAHKGIFCCGEIRTGTPTTTEPITEPKSEPKSEPITEPKSESATEAHCGPFSGACA